MLHSTDKVIFIFLLTITLITACSSPAKAPLKIRNQLPIIEQDTPVSQRPEQQKITDQEMPAPELILDPAGHTAQVWKVVFTSDEKYIITGSDDKTVKVWDVETGDCIKTFRGYSESGNIGRVYSIALSPDNRYLATGGWFKGEYSRDPGLGAIRIYGFKKGKLVKLLRGHKGVIFNLEFSPDGRYLASSSADKNILIWDVANDFNLLSTLSHQNKYVFGISFSKDGKSLASASYDRSIALWDLTSGQLIKSLEQAHEQEIHRIEYSPDGKFLATGSYDGTVKLWDAKSLKFVKLINELVAGSTAEIKFSPDNQYLVFGGSYGRYIDGRPAFPVYFYNLESGEIDKQFLEHNNSVLSLAFSRSGQWMASAGGNEDEVYIYNPANLELKQIIRSKGRTIFALAFGNNNKTIYFGNINNGFSSEGIPLDNATIQRGFSLLDFSIKPAMESRYIRVYNEIELQTFEYTGGYFNNTIKIAANTLILPEEYNGIRCYSFTPDGRYAIIGTAHEVYKVDVETGEIIGSFKGIRGETWAISISRDGKYLIGGGGDQTIKLWCIDDFTGEKVFYSYDWFSNRWKDMVQKDYPQIDLHKQQDIEQLYHMMKKQNHPEAEKLVKKYPTCEPVVTIFLSRDDEYLVYTPDHYYMGDKSLFKYIGWHINQAEDEEAHFYPFEQFDLKYNRPDIIMQRLGLASEGTIQAYYALYKKRLKKMGFTEKDLSGELHLPEVSLAFENNQSTTKEDRINLKIYTFDSQYLLDRINIFINDVPILGRTGIPLKDKRVKDYNTDIDLNLLYGKNKIQVSVLNEKGVESLKETRIIYCNKSKIKPDLYIATVGVSRYQDSSYDLYYADKDARDIISAYQANKELFADVYVLNLNNEKAIKQNIMQVKDFFNKSRMDDFVILFLAGHGMRDKNNEYYFCTHDIDFNNPKQNGFLFDEIDSLIDGIPALTKLILMDTCFSGEMDEDIETTVMEIETGNKGRVLSRSTGRGLKVMSKQDKLQSLLVKQNLFADLRKGTGAIVLTSSSGIEYSYEGVTEQGELIRNGVFTYAFLSGINEYQADKNEDNSIQVSEIVDWVYLQVLELTQGQQTPGMRRENIEFDYLIY